MFCPSVQAYGNISLKPTNFLYESPIWHTMFEHTLPDFGPAAWYSVLFIHHRAADIGGFVFSIGRL